MLGIKKTAGAHSAEAGLPTYIPRDHDSELQRAIRGIIITGGFLVLVGEPASGKSRSAYEAVRAILPEWTLVRAHMPQDLAQAALEDASSRVIWLDDMYRLLAAQQDGVATDEIAGLLESHQPVVLIGTLWPGHYDHFAGLDEVNDAAAYPNPLPPAPSVTKEIFRLARKIVVGDVLSESERDCAVEAAVHDAQISGALEVEDFSLFQTLAGTPELLRRWHSGMPSGRAVITAAVDARLLGAADPLGRQFLTDAALGYLLPPQVVRLTPDWADKALGYATATLDGGCAALSPAPEGSPGTLAGYDPADVLVRAGEELRRFGPVPEEAWRALLTHVSDNSSLMRIGWNAQWRLLYELAHEFYLAAGPDGALSRARLFIDQDKAEKACEILLPMADRGDTEALGQLSLVAMRSSDPASRLASLRSLPAVKLGGTRDLGRELEAQGQTDEAIATWSALAENGDTRAAVRAARLLVSAGRGNDAITLLRCYGGKDHSARSMLANLHLEAGESDQAESLLRTWAADGDNMAAGELALLFEKQNRENDLTILAEEGNDVARNILLRAWIDRAGEQPDFAEKAISMSKHWDDEDDHPWSELHVLKELGRTDQALDVAYAYEREHGSNDDLNALISGNLLKAGRVGELHARADSGDTRAQNYIAGQLAEKNDLDGLANYATRGHYAACVELSRLLENGGRVDDAIAVWRQAAESDHYLGQRHVIDLLREHGRDQELVALLEDEPISCGKGVGRALASALTLTGQIAKLKERANAGDGYADEELAGYLVSIGHWDELRERAVSGSGAATRQLLANDSDAPEHREIVAFGLRPDASIAIPADQTTADH